MSAIANGQSRDASIRELSRGVAVASEPQIMRIVATVDAMAARGVADDLIAPLRHRLVNLRPARPMRFARLVFFPLDPLIVPAAGWRPTHHTLPRTALAPMAQLVEATLGAEVVTIKAAIHHRKADQADLVPTLGASLWPRAGSILVGADVPAGWAATGLGDQAYHRLARRIGALLSVAPALDEVCVATAQGLLPPDPASVIAMVRAVSGLAPDALPMLVALLLIRMPQAAALLYEIDAGSDTAGVKSATDQAADLLLDRLERSTGADAVITANTLAEAGVMAGKVARLLNELDRDDATAARRKQLRAIRQKIDTDCRARFEAGINADLLVALHALPEKPGAGDIIGLETIARNLRTLEGEARGFGNGDTYDRLLAQTAETIQAQGDARGTEFADRVRMVEILAGSEAALKMLEQR